MVLAREYPRCATGLLNDWEGTMPVYFSEATLSILSFGHEKRSHSQEL